MQLGTFFSEKGLNVFYLLVSSFVSHNFVKYLWGVIRAKIASNYNLVSLAIWSARLWELKR